MSKDEKNVVVNAIEKYKRGKIADYYVNPVHIEKILEEALSMPYNDILAYLENAKVSLTYDQIQEYLNRKTLLRKKVEYETRNDRFPIKCAYTIENLSPATLNYFINYIKILKENCLDFLNLYHQIHLNKLKALDENNNQLFQSILVKYDIKLNEDGDVSYLDMIRLLVPFVYSIENLEEKTKQANQLDTYLFFSVSKHSLQMDLLCEDDLLPGRTIQLDNLYDVCSEDGYIPLTEQQREKMLQKGVHNFGILRELFEEIL